MTITVVIMIIIGIIICISSFFVGEKFSGKKDNLQNLMMVDDDYEFSERELRIIRRKIEDVIANQAKDILYETNESLSNMANEKTLALGDYAVAVCEEIEKNHKEVMFLYSMLDDKQKEIMKTVRIVNDANKEAKDMLEDVKRYDYERTIVEAPPIPKQSALEQLMREEVSSETVVTTEQVVQDESIYEPDNSDIEEDVEDSSISDLDNMDDVFAELDQTDIDFDDVLEEEFKENENSNDIILQMHRNGNSVLEIAKQLGLGVGEVKLVIDLYQGV